MPAATPPDVVAVMSTRRAVGRQRPVTSCSVKAPEGSEPQPPIYCSRGWEGPPVAAPLAENHRTMRSHSHPVVGLVGSSRTEKDLRWIVVVPRQALAWLGSDCDQWPEPNRVVMIEGVILSQRVILRPKMNKEGRYYEMKQARL